MTQKILRLVLGRTPIKILRASLYLVLLWILLCPTGAVAQCPDETGDINFRVTRKANINELNFETFVKIPPNSVMQVVGPSLRRSERINLSGLPLDTPCNFYAAKDGLFSPYGSWYFYVWDPNGPTPSHPTAFLCIESRGTSDVEIGQSRFGYVLGVPRTNRHRCVYKNYGLLWALAVPNGVNQPQGALDTDVFEFEGTAGDTVTVELETDDQSGNNGGEATLRLTGGTLNRVKTGNLPLTIKADIPATGTYDVSVEQSGHNPFKGYYNVSVGSEKDLIRGVVPTDLGTPP
jgi:hypothetical protein